MNDSGVCQNVSLSGWKSVLVTDYGSWTACLSSAYHLSCVWSWSYAVLYLRSGFGVFEMTQTHVCLSVWSLQTASHLGCCCYCGVWRSVYGVTSPPSLPPLESCGWGCVGATVGRGRGGEKGRNGESLAFVVVVLG